MKERRKKEENMALDLIFLPILLYMCKGLLLYMCKGLFFLHFKEKIDCFLLIAFSNKLFGNF